MDTVNLKCTYEERTSKKDNKKYKAVFIKLSDEYEKMIFLSIPETVLLENSIKSSNEVSENPFVY